MTGIKLINSIANVLKDDILANIKYLPSVPKVFKHDIPLSSDYEYEGDTEETAEEKYFPCCIVRMANMKISDASKPQESTVEIVTVIKDWAEDMSGYETLIIVLERIRDYFIGHAGISEKYRLNYPVEIAINKETTTPYYMGSVILRWSAEYTDYIDVQKYV